MIGTVRQVGKSHIVLHCSNEYVVECDHHTIQKHKKILRKGALVGILRIEAKDGHELKDLFRIRTISCAKMSLEEEEGLRRT